KQCLPRSTPISDTVSMMVLQKDKILTQRSPLSEDRADHPIKREPLRFALFYCPAAVDGPTMRLKPRASSA
ncbi:hypothetical protein, partial [Burkholderia sp. KCJ3K979]|uniref:hypothetical protein n=1 Tax=Burkholderia sp. KCJ3K979 TaxID=2759149 RepID=UPI001F46FEB5